MSSTRIPADPTGDLATTEVGSDLIGSGQEGGLVDQVRAWLQRVRGGDMGALPAVAGFIVLSVLFSVLSPFFLTERNFANLMTQAATLVMLGMALVFVILLGEIDLSAGVTAGVTMCIFIVLVNVQGVNWIVALAIAFAIGIADRHVHRLLRRQGGHSILRRDAGPVPRPAGRRADRDRRGRTVPGADPGDPGDPEREPADLGRLGAARGHAHRLCRDLCHRPQPADARRGSEPHDHAGLGEARPRSPCSAAPSSTS